MDGHTSALQGRISRRGRCIQIKSVPIYADSNTSDLRAGINTVKRYPQ